jgi:hypothetical protein
MSEMSMVAMPLLSRRHRDGAEDVSKILSRQQQLLYSAPQQGSLVSSKTVTWQRQIFSRDGHLWCELFIFFISIRYIHFSYTLDSTFRSILKK